jgi:hypothetical protein
VAIEARVLAEDDPSRLLSEELLARAYKAAGLTAKLESQPPSQADDEQGSGSSSATTSTAEPEGLLPLQPPNIAPSVHDEPSQEKGKRVGVRGKLKKVWQKLKDNG